MRSSPEDCAALREAPTSFDIFFDRAKDGTREEPVEDAHLLLLKIIEQTVRDYITPVSDTGFCKNNRPGTYEKETAISFLFDDDYYILFGDRELNLETILHGYFDIDLDYFRRKVKELSLSRRIKYKEKFRI